MLVNKETDSFLDFKLINDTDSDIISFFQNNQTAITNSLQQSLTKFSTVKANFQLDIVLSKYVSKHDAIIEKPTSRPAWSKRLLKAVKSVPSSLKTLYTYVTSKLKTYFNRSPSEAEIQEHVTDSGGVTVTTFLETDAIPILNENLRQNNKGSTRPRTSAGESYAGRLWLVI